MGAAGAAVFAAQMMNFTIAGTGSSGHIGGGFLLAAVLGPVPAYLVMSVILTVQCLLFGDGGLLALGCNLFNMGIVPCFLIYPLLKKLLGTKMRIPAAALGGALSMFTGALCVVGDARCRRGRAHLGGAHPVGQYPVRNDASAGLRLPRGGERAQLGRGRPDRLRSCVCARRADRCGADAHGKGCGLTERSENHATDSARDR
nr:energy-coupling factor ABC transporter permease [uncultured Agathobaculum sp.]